MDRRHVLIRAGLALGAGRVPTRSALAEPATVRQAEGVDWEAVRDQFALAPDLVQMAGFYLASHPAPVREAIERHRRGLDADPHGYVHDNNDRLVGAVLRSAGDYLGVEPREIALTDSTTMGLGLLYGGLDLRADQEILTTTHDFYATTESLRLRAERTGAVVRSVALYDDPAAASIDEMVARLIAEVRPATRIVAVTWVHSGTGVRLPIRAMADALAQFNADRAEGDRALLCVDGVHGLGVEDLTLPDLGCDFFVSGCHKWLLGPRGTGLIWGAPHAWSVVRPTIPSFDVTAYLALDPSSEPPPAAFMTPGGFHSFEHRWALDAAFGFHQGIGKAPVAARIHELSRRLKEGLMALPHVTLYTPLTDELSAGIVCFAVAGLAPEEVVDRLRERRIVASVSPYATSYARLGLAIFNTEVEIELVLQEVARLRP
jgi:isopenicillin-N epimerase